MRDGVYQIGVRGQPLYWCEGYATALSVQAALRYLSRQGQVVVCFSAGTLARVARHGYVIADNDASEAGEKAARETGLPWWMPPKVGMDANDWHMSQGVSALADGITRLYR